MVVDEMVTVSTDEICAAIKARASVCGSAVLGVPAAPDPL